MNISACNSLVNSTRNLNNIKKQFAFNNEVIQDAANVMNNISEANYSYASHQGKNLFYIFIYLHKKLLLLFF